MSTRWQLRVYDSERLVYEAELTGVAELGRQQNDAENKPGDAFFRPWHYQANGVWRVVISSLKEIAVSRTHLEVRPLPNGRFLLTNRSASQAVTLPNRTLDPSASSEVSFPVVVQFGTKTAYLQAPDKAAGEEMASLPHATMGVLLSNVKDAIAKTVGPEMPTENLTGWIQAFVGLLHSAAGSFDFFGKAARAIVDLVNLDSGRVLIRAGDRWEEKAMQCISPEADQSEWQPSRRILAGVLREKKTFWEVPDLQGGMSVRDIDAVVAAPILDHRGEVIGALYGERRMLGATVQRPISQLEAMLVEVLASGVAAGLARVGHERAELQMRVQMEQYFTAGLAAKLEKHPELLQGRDTEVTILFCDIRAFSRISERLGSAKTVEWISDVMSDLSQCVLDHEGVVVDYIGDELMAMWGAPDQQLGHAALACRAGLAMFERLVKMNERWEPIIKEPLNLGIGINSGIAQVGNVGSRIKFKYGALGNTVNLASRVQGATKYLKTRLLITDSTRAGLDESFNARRLCQIRVINIEKPVTIYELVGTDQPGWDSLKLGYEQAVEEFTKGEFRQACRILGRLILDHPDDGPALLLLSRAVAFLVDAPDSFDPVMVLSGK